MDEVEKVLPQSIRTFIEHPDTVKTLGIGTPKGIRNKCFICGRPFGRLTTWIKYENANYQGMGPSILLRHLRPCLDRIKPSEDILGLGKPRPKTGRSRSRK